LFEFKSKILDFKLRLWQDVPPDKEIGQKGVLSKSFSLVIF